MASKSEAKEEGFEALYKRLEETVAKLEQGNLSLEESLSLYEEGMQLAQRCQALLQDAEQRVTRLQQQFSNGSSTMRDDLPAHEAPIDDDDPPLE